jgi:hypothetical protein
MRLSVPKSSSYMLIVGVQGAKQLESEVLLFEFLRVFGRGAFGARQHRGCYPLVVERAKFEKNAVS